MTKNENPAVKLVEITLTATTCVQYTEVVSVPADITPEELQALVNDRYNTVGGDEFDLVPGSWDRGDCGADDALARAKPSLKAVRVEGGLLVQELEHNHGMGRVLTDETEVNDEPHLLGKIEVPYRVAAGSGLPEKAVVQAMCDAAVKKLRAVHEGSDVVVFDRDFHARPQHCVVSVAVPVYRFDTDESSQVKLAKAFEGFEDIEKLFTAA